MLTGTWLARVKLLAGLRFLPPALLPRLLLDALLAEFFLFLLLVVVCRVGSALHQAHKHTQTRSINKRQTHTSILTKMPQCECMHTEEEKRLFQHMRAYKHRGEYTNASCFFFFFLRERKNQRAFKHLPRHALVRKNLCFHLHKCSTVRTAVSAAMHARLYH